MAIRGIDHINIGTHRLAETTAFLVMPVVHKATSAPNEDANIDIESRALYHSAFQAYIAMKKTADGEPQTAIMAAFGTEFYTKHVIVVDDDVDIFDLNDVMWAVATRVHAEKDIFFIPGAKGAILDPTSDPQNFTVTKMGIDATRPSGRDFAERLLISDEQRAKARKILQSAGIRLDGS